VASPAHNPGTFVDRRQELSFLDNLLGDSASTRAQLVLLYGRRRVGKTVLARHWAETTGRPAVYWAVEREPANLQRRKLAARMLNMPLAQAPVFSAWTDLWSTLASLVGDQARILIIDEVTYAAESDPAFLSSLQHAWDQRLRHSRLVILLSGSHVHTMETLLAHGSPLFGRFTGQWHLQPLGFAALRQFLPRWPADRRVAVYAILGGIPAYLEWLRPEKSLSANLREVILAPGSLFVAEPELLLYDELREPRVYDAILQAIGGGAHALDDIANSALIGKTHLSAYLGRLQELRLVERRLPATVPPARRRISRLGRYHIADPFLRFYFSFVAPRRDELGYRPEPVLAAIQAQLRAFVGNTAFEALARDWVAWAANTGQLPLEADSVGSFWSRLAQVDVAAVNWAQKQLLLGECKWGAGPVEADVLRQLEEKKAPLVLKSLPGEPDEWTVQFVLFSRAGFKANTRALAAATDCRLVDLAQLDRDLSGQSRTGSKP
jgi:AAA+ ATPase superfamily predicted ATPase